VGVEYVAYPLALCVLREKSTSGDGFFFYGV